MPPKIVEVTWEDQRNINAFGKLNTDFQTTKALIQNYKKEMEGLEEAQNELILVDDDDAARYLFGLCFVHTPNDDADSRITKDLERIQSEVSKLEDKQSELTEQLDKLKQTLYGKFGDQINLEDE